MGDYLKRQLSAYVEYHRDPRNSAMHVFGIITLFLGAVLPLNLWPIHVFGVSTTMAPFMALPVLIYWLLLDAALGVAILVAAGLILSAASLIVSSVSLTTVWIITAVLIVVGLGAQYIGHQYFERRQPSLVDNPSHLLLGPIFVMAKLFIALGFRHDLDVVLRQPPAPQGSSLYPEPRQIEPHPHS
jgi:uncharacterized membrane protein YGL010W